VRVWDAKTGQPLHTLERVGCVYSMAFSRNGSRLLTNNGTVLLPLPASTPPAFLLKASARAISIVKRWLTVDAVEMIWIPANYAPSLTAVHSCHVAFGYRSGRVLLLEIRLAHFGCYICPSQLLPKLIAVVHLPV
jgi:hypothetical protein